MDQWVSAAAYDRFVGRWSRKVAVQFLGWLDAAQGLKWIDVGCGTGTLVETILAVYDPAAVFGIDPADAFLSVARQRITDPRVRWDRGEATNLPLDAGVGDISVSGLVLNFVDDPMRMVREQIRVTRNGGLIAGYVWDYAGGMQMVRYFWDVAREVSPQDAWLDQGERHPVCQPAPLAELFENAGLKRVEVVAVNIPTVFESFEDYWQPFLGGTGAAPSYLARIDEEVRSRIRQGLVARLPMNGDGQIPLEARAWAVRGRVEPVI